MDHVGTAAPGCPAAQVYRAAGLCFRIIIPAEHVENENPPAQSKNLP